MSKGRGWRRALACGALLVLGYVLLARYDAPRGGAGAWLRNAGLTARQVEVDGRSVRFVRAGSGPPVVLVHGFAASIFTWSEILPALAREHDVVALDLPGFGGSDLPADLSWPELPRAVGGLLERLGLARASLVGHSLGGAVVLTLAARAPERVDKLVLVDSAGFNVTPSERPKLIGLVASPALGGVIERVPLRRTLLQVGLRQVFHDDALVTSERVEEYLEPLARPGWLPAMRSLLRSRQEELADFPALLGQVRAPTLIVWGRDDRWAPVDHARRFHEGLPGSQLTIFDACGHVPQEERPQDTLRELAKFLN